MTKMRLWIARLFAAKVDQVAIDNILKNCVFGNDGDVVVVVNSRFFSPFTIAKKRTAITQLLQVIGSIGARCAEKKLSCSIAFKEALDETITGKVVFAHHTHNGMFSRAFISKNEVFHFKSGDLPNTLTIDPNGFAGWSTISSASVSDLVNNQPSFNEVEAFFNKKSLEIKQSNHSKYQQRGIQEAKKLPERFVFVALQTVGDIVQQNALIDIFTMLDTTVDSFSNTDVSVLIKRHPKCRNAKMKAAITRVVENNSNVFETGQSIHVLLNQAEALYTVNSGVGSEAMIYNIPIYCFGRSDYGAIAHVLDDVETAKSMITCPEPKVSYEELVRFHYFYRKEFQISSDDALNAKIERIITGKEGSQHA